MTLLALQQGFRDWLTTEEVHGPDLGTEAVRAGLSVYLNTYRGQLLACLAESYGTVHAWLGDEAFVAAAARHIDEVPPRSWTLDDYALGFPATLDALYPRDPEVGELARLERALVQAFTARDHAAVDPAGLAAVDWERAVIRFDPSLQWIEVRTNAAAIWSAIAAGDAPPAAGLLPAPATVLVWREAFAPVFRTLEGDEAEALRHVRAGRGFAEVCRMLVERHGAEQGQQIAGACLARWLGDGIIAHVGS